MCGIQACADRTTEPIVGGAAPRPASVARLQCTANVVAKTLGCLPAREGANADIILGGQGTYIQLSASHVSYDAGTGVFLADLTVQNLTGQQLGTPDGFTVGGVKVFLTSLEPSSAVTLSTGQLGTFTAPNQVYVDYHEILEAFGGTSHPITWHFNVPSSIASFTFTVLVSAPAVNESGVLRWQTERGFGNYSNTFVYGIDSRNVFAFGRRFDDGRDDELTSVDRFDGTGWHNIATDLDIDVKAAWGSSTTDLWIGGDYGVAHFDGHTWQSDTVRSGAEVVAMWGSGANDVYAVADGQVYHHGTAAGWSLVTMPTGQYFAISGLSANDVYAAGSVCILEAEVCRDSAVVVHFDGVQWTGVTNLPAEAAFMFFDSGEASVFAAAGEVWVSGGGGTLHLKGGVWHFIGTPAFIHALQGSGPSNLVGVSVTDCGDCEQFFVVNRWDPSSETWIQLPNPPPASFFGSVWPASPTDIWAINEELRFDEVAIIEANPWHFDGTSWSAHGNNIGIEAETEALNAIAGVDASHLWAVGSSGQILTNTNGGWHQVGPEDHSTSWNGVWAASNSDVWVVGDNARIMHWTGGSSLTAVPTPSEIAFESITAIYGFSPTDIWAGTDYGTLLHYVGGAWTHVSADISLYAVNAIWGPASNDVYAVGASGEIAHYDGTSWSIRGSGVGDLFGIRTLPADVPPRPIVIGQYGGIFHDTGDGFAAEAAGTDANLKTMFSLSSGEIFAAGDRGTLLRRTSTGTWSPIATGISGSIRGIWADRTSNVYLVGVGGFIVRGSR
jgi:hypothetical protein